MIRKIPHFVVGLGLAVIAVPFTTDAYNLYPYTEYTETLGAWPEAVVIGDVTGDGRDDVVVATSSYNNPPLSFSLFVYAQTPQGSLAPAVQVPYLGTAPSQGVRLALADFDHDGIGDVAVCVDQGVSLAFGRGGAGFATQRVDLPGLCSAMGVSDLDGDGNSDLVRQSDDGTIAILLGDGTGHFRAAPSLSAYTAWHQALRIDDVTGDGVPDLVFTNQLALTVYPGAGRGAFQAPRELPYPEDEPRGFSSVAIGDINHDGRNDILATLSANQPKSKIWVYQQGADGTLLTPRSIWTYDLAEALAIADLDRNGYPDVLTMHGGWYAIGVYLQTQAGLGDELRGWVPYATHYDLDAIATGDLNGDGCTDIAIGDYNNGLLVFDGYECFAPRHAADRYTGDFDGDGTSDVFWHNAATGANVIWRSGNATTTIPVTTVTDTRWSVSGVGDFDGDGRADVLWHHRTTGANVIWRNGDSRMATTLTRTAAGWQVVGLGDFAGDGKADILWRHAFTGANALWNDGASSRSVALPTVPDPDWSVAGIGDFDGDRRDDILWRHRVDGRNVIWRHADVHSATQLTAVTDVAWDVAAVGDFDGDGRSDLFWRHAWNGRSAIWPHADATSARSVPTVADLRWAVAGTGDFNHDGRSDVLWRHATGANLIWPDGSAAGQRALTGVTNMQWSIVR